MLLYLSTYQSGAGTGMGLVMEQEVMALRELGLDPVSVYVITPGTIQNEDEVLLNLLQSGLEKGVIVQPRLAHFLGTRHHRAMAFLRSLGCRITSTCSYCDVQLTNRELLRLGWWRPDDPIVLAASEEVLHRSSSLADVLICPSSLSAVLLRPFDCSRIEVIPHGCELTLVAPLPDKFVVGFLGMPLPEKGLIYLLQAWQQLNDVNAMLFLCGPNIIRMGFSSVVREYDTNSNIYLHDWIRDTKRFFSLISVYVQPSITESFGLPVLEAMANGRAVLCSDGAGAAELVPKLWQFPAGDSAALARKIDEFRQKDLVSLGRIAYERAREYTWPKIRKRYQQVWQEVLA